jgi:glycosyltransferase involved in cell wall biosynthesis
MRLAPHVSTSQSVNGVPKRADRHRRATPPIILDLQDLGVNTFGVGRTLAEVATRLLALDPGRCRAICTEASLPLLRDVDRSLLTVVHWTPRTFFEQVTLPLVSARLGAGAVYSFRECGALWGPPLLLHVTEDPEVRWSQESLRESSTEGRVPQEIMRRTYSRFLMNRSLRRARVVTCTRASALDLQRHHGIAADQVTVIPLGVDLHIFRPKDKLISNDASYFFHLVTTKPRDNTRLVIAAFARLVAQSTEPIRLIVGGDLHDSATEVRALVRGLGIEDKVEFLGRVADERLSELYSGAVAVVLASMYEGFGLPAIEALACGALLISLPAPAVTEITAGADVVWAQPNVGSMVGAMAAALQDPDRRVQACQTNRLVASRFTWDRTASELLALLSDLAGEDKR